MTKNERLKRFNVEKTVRAYAEVLAYFLPSKPVARLKANCGIFGPGNVVERKLGLFGFHSLFYFWCYQVNSPFPFLNDTAKLSQNVS